MLRIGMRFSRDERQVAVRASDGEQAGEARIDLRGGQRVQMAVVPVRPCGMFVGDIVRVGVRHARRDVQQNVVGISLRADVQAVDVEVERRRGQLLRVDRHRLALGRVLRAEVVPDGQVGEGVVRVDDQRLAGKHLQRRRRVEIRRPTSSRPTPCRGSPRSRRAGSSGPASPPYRGWPALARGEPDLEHAVLARQRHGLTELGPNCRVERAPASCAEARGASHPTAERAATPQTKSARRIRSLCDRLPTKRSCIGPLGGMWVGKRERPRSRDARSPYANL